MYLADLLADIFFNLSLNILRSHIKGLAKWEDVETRNTKAFMKDDGFWSVLVREGTGRKDSCGTTYVKYVTEVPRKLIAFCQKDDITFRSELKRHFLGAASPSITTEYHRICYQEVKKEVKGARDSASVRNENSYGFAKLFIG